MREGLPGNKSFGIVNTCNFLQVSYKVIHHKYNKHLQVATQLFGRIKQGWCLSDRIQVKPEILNNVEHAIFNSI